MGVAEEKPDWGLPIAYLVLERGTAVYATGESEIGTVEHVLYVAEEDIFDGIVVQTPTAFGSSTRPTSTASTSGG